MRTSALLTVITMVGLLTLCGGQGEDACLTTITLSDTTGGNLLGLIRVTDAQGRHVDIPELLSRGLGLDESLPIANWSVLPATTAIKLPRSKLLIEAICGLETELSHHEIDLTNKTTAKVNVCLKQFSNMSEQGYRSANTHLHLQKISREECDRYLREVPRADRLDMLFLSYLERAGADREYTSNRYTIGDLTSLTQKSGVVFGNGEEHRHNFAGFGQGYGHVMLLNIKKMIQPVSIGPGIMKLGHDGLPLRRGINTARNDGATIVWCHNDWGLESTPNWLAGKVDAQNIFDGGTRSSYKDSFYRYLNAGLRVPFSTGTDWFMYDFSRVYVKLEGELTPANWLQALSAGRSYITNGPLLDFHIDDAALGDDVNIADRPSVNVKARAVGRLDFEQLELVHNGEVTHTVKTTPMGGHFEAAFQLRLPVNSPGWLAVRTPPPSVKDDPQLQTARPLNELGRELFAHTSPIYLTVNGRRHFDSTVATELLAEMQASRDAIPQQGKFEDDQALARVLDVYDEGITALRNRLERQ